MRLIKRFRLIRKLYKLRIREKCIVEIINEKPQQDVLIYLLEEWRITTKKIEDLEGQLK